MPITEILVCANGPGLLESRLKLALQVGRAFQSRIEVVFFREAQNPSAVPSYEAGFNASPRHDLARSAWDEEAGRLARAKETYDRCMKPGHTALTEGSEPADAHVASWSEVRGSAADLFPSRARACDLVVAGGPGSDASSSTLDDEISAMALLASGRMTLLAPRPGHLQDDIFRSVLIAWDDSAAVSRTLAQAMPLVTAAREVRLFVGETSPEGATRCNDILSYLRRKGTHPTVERSVPALYTIRETLVQQAWALGASLIVMGAYKHSRTREILLGGTTRHVIQHAGCAVLMAS